MKSIDTADLFASAVRDLEINNSLAQALSLHTSGHTRDAMEAYKQVLIADENNIVALNNLSLMLDDETAIKLLLRAQEIKPDYIDALVNLSSRYYSMKNISEMQRHLEHALALDPNNKSAIQLAKLIDHPSKARVEPLDLPKYSIIVPTHRRANLLDRALSSIKLQICNSNHEVIVVSDCVEAETDEVCRRWLGSSDTYVRRSGVPGPSDSRNLALKLARGKFVLFLDDDDAWHQGLLASLDECQILNSGHPVYFNCSVVKESRKSSKPHRIGEKFLDTSGLLDLNVFVKNQVHMSCFAFPTELVRNLEFDTHMRAYEDWDFLLSVFEQQMPQHHPFLGSAVHEVDDESSDRRGNSQPAQDFNAVIDYLYVYRRHPVSTELQLSRARLLASAGLQLSSDLL